MEKIVVKLFSNVRPETTGMSRPLGKYPPVVYLWRDARLAHHLSRRSTKKQWRGGGKKKEEVFSCLNF